MKIQILADLHAEFESGDGADLLMQRSPWKQMTSTAAEVVVLAGDTHTRGRGPALARALWPHRQIVMVAGNHEFYGSALEREIPALRSEAARYPDLHFLENDSVEIGGAVFLGCCLWSDFRLYGTERGPYCQLIAQGQMADYEMIRSVRGGGYKTARPDDTFALHRESVKWLRQRLEELQGKKVVVVTHHAPSSRSIPAQYKGTDLSAAFASNLEWMIETFQPTLWIHGHTHAGADYLIGQTRIVGNPRGYPGEKTGFAPALVVEV